MAEATKKAASEAPVVTTAAQAQQEDEEWVFTFRAQTGEVVKIEKLDKGGQRTELTEEEYAAVSGQDMSGASDYYGESGYYGQEYDPYGLEQAYYQGMMDSESMMGMGGGGMMAGSYQMTPEEQAYYQGMQDYMEACGL